MDNILIVEDELSQREMLADYFRPEANTMFTAKHGEEALSIISNQKIDIVVSDIQMPKMDGLRLVKKVTQNKPNLPIILVTGFGTIETAVEAMKIGATDFLLKPIDLTKLSRLIMINLERSRENRWSADLTLFSSGTISYNLPAYKHYMISALSGRLCNLIIQHGYMKPQRRNAVCTVIYEALSNAMYHGALGIPSEGLIVGDTGAIDFMNEVEKRILLEEYREKSVSVLFTYDGRSLTLKILDLGDGFNWQEKLREMESPDNLNRLFGRGLLIITKIMGENNFQFNKDGNSISLFFRMEGEE